METVAVQAAEPPPSGGWLEIRPLFVLVVAVSGNFLGDTLGCGMRRLLAEDIFVRHALLILTIYVALETQKSILARAVHSVAMWLLFLAFTKMDARFTLATLLGLVVSYELELRARRNADERALALAKRVEIGVMLLMAVGVAHYAIRQRSDHAARWSWPRFLFGVPTCGGKR
tara:strand:- start:759 stop:1277 length:519 start_codon:yes stop_codon:yes gene_type:complete